MNTSREVHDGICIKKGWCGHISIDCNWCEFFKRWDDVKVAEAIDYMKYSDLQRRECTPR